MGYVRAVKLSYAVLGVMEIGLGVLTMRYRESIVDRLQQSRRPFPTSEERDSHVVLMAGPFTICIGIVTVFLGLI